MTERSPQSSRRRTARLVLGLALLVAPLAACRYVAAFTYLFHLPQIQKAEVKLTPERLVFFIDPVRPGEDSILFRQALHDKLDEVLREQKVPTHLVPQQEVLQLQQQNPDFATWSVQKIGRKLGARQVLWTRVERLQLFEAPDSPLLAPSVQLRLKLIDTEQPRETARLWPSSQEPEGRLVQRARQAREASGQMVLDEEAAKLGKDTAWLVAAPFYDRDTEQKIPWEP